MMHGFCHTRSLSENSIWRRAACLNAGLRQAQSPIYPISTHSPSLPAFKPLALGSDDEFSDTLLDTGLACRVSYPDWWGVSSPGPRLNPIYTRKCFYIWPGNGMIGVAV